jgi:hypothetical protein
LQRNVGGQRQPYRPALVVATDRVPPHEVLHEERGSDHVECKAHAAQVFLDKCLALEVGHAAVAVSPGNRGVHQEREAGLLGGITDDFALGDLAFEAVSPEGGHGECGCRTFECATDRRGIGQIGLHHLGTKPGQPLRRIRVDVTG